MKFVCALLLLILVSPATLVNAQSDGGVRIKFNGFGDIIGGVPFGMPANANSATLFNKYGDYEYPYELRRGVVLHGLDLLTSVYLTDNIKMQAEVNLEGDIGSGKDEIGVEVDRFFIDYTISDHFGMQAGLMYTPIGYINRNLYSRAWLQNAANFYQAVEQDAGLIQSHFVGGTAYGNYKITDNNGISYILGLGMPRPSSPTQPIYYFGQLGYQATALVEFHTIKGESDLKIGLSGYTDQIHTFNIPNYGQIVDITSPLASPMLLQETGFDPYVVLKSKLFDVIVEDDYVLMNVLKGDYPRTTTMNYLSAEVAFNGRLKGKRFAPYVRYDVISLPSDTGPYYGLRAIDNSHFTKDYSPDMKTLMVGIAYDIAAFNRIKLEYIHNFDGPFMSDGVFVQTAFGF